MKEFFKTLACGYSQLFNDAKSDFFEYGPKILTGTGTGLMMIGSALIARDSCKAEVQKVIKEANELVEKEKNTDIKSPEPKYSKKRRVLKAKVKKGWKIVKVYKKGFIVSAIGGVFNGVGLGVSENGRHKAIAGAATLGGILSSYRAAVVADLGPEADIKYLNGEKVVNVPKKKKGAKDETGEGNELVETSEDGLTVYRDPNAFRLKYSRETTPDFWHDNYDLRISDLEWLEALLSRKYMNTWEYGGNLTLNDMRREFSRSNPNMMDVQIGGLFGRHYVKEDPKTHKLVNLHFRDDKDFMAGRKDWCWIIFDCDPEPLIYHRKGFTQIEKG